MIRIGLTGGMGMGKSTAAAMLQQMGCALHDADAAVHRLTASGGEAVPLLRAAFPQAFDVATGAYDRSRMAAHIAQNPEDLPKLEALLHPLVRADQQAFIRQQRRFNRHRPIVFDVPLLFEAGLDQEMDVTFCVLCPARLQRQRLLRRPNMTSAKMHILLTRQWPAKDKAAASDYVIPTGLGRAATRRHLARTLEEVVSAALIRPDGAGVESRYPDALAREPEYGPSESVSAPVVLQ